MAVGKSSRTSRSRTWVREHVARDVLYRTRDERGQDVIEYALLATIISVSAVSVLVLIGPQLNNLLQVVVNGLH